MIKVIEIKTPNCTRCKQFEPEYQRIKTVYPNIEYSELVFGQNTEAMEYAKTYGIKAAPTFIVINIDEQGNEFSQAVKPENLEESIKLYHD